MRTVPLLMAAVLLAPPLARAAEIAVVEDASGDLEVHGAIELGHTVSAAAAWKVLTDYERLPRFVPHLERSRIVESGPHGLLVEQVAEVPVLLFTRQVRVLLHIEEHPPHAIDFHDESGEDFTRYLGSWRLDETERGVVVRYALIAHPKLPIPAALARVLTERQALTLLQAVETELERSVPAPDAGSPR